MKDALEYYHVLQVTPETDAEIIKKNYRELAKKWHPDYNQEQDTTDIFQKISVAYETLSDKHSRLTYDILSLVYDKDNYPDLEVITPFKDGSEGINLRMVDLLENRGWFFGSQTKRRSKALGYNGALRLSAKVALVNWVIGWWHPSLFFKNIKTLIDNFKQPLSDKESLKILLHNMIAFAKEGQSAAAVRCGHQALNLLPTTDKGLVEEYLLHLNTKAACPKQWNVFMLKAVQLIFPVALFLILLLPAAGSYMHLSEAELWSLFSKKKEIDYYQKVDFGARGQSVDDVVVSKVMSIPVDKSDDSKLYHLTIETRVMYGPSAEFDVVKILPENTTVRLTGKTPDNVWARVMIDNGESGFVRYEEIKQGIGKEIPYGSSIID